MVIAEYKLYFSKRALKDLPKIQAAKLSERVQALCQQLIKNPTANIMSKKLLGNYGGKYSMRINLQHRLVYEIHKELRMVRILRMWGHYDDN